MKLLAYDAATMGNHEFNYGLPYLSQITNVDFGLKGIAKGTPQTNPAGAKDCAALAFLRLGQRGVGRDQATHLQALGGAEQELQGHRRRRQGGRRDAEGGVIGFRAAAHPAMDKANSAAVEVTGWKETAARYVPEMKAAGADLIVALAHGGIDLKTPYSASMENGAAYLTQVPGIDALITGHQHLLFPDTNPSRSSPASPASTWPRA